jgi:hypothetical protein
MPVFIYYDNANSRRFNCKIKFYRIRKSLINHSGAQPECVIALRDVACKSFAPFRRRRKGAKVRNCYYWQPVNLKCEKRGSMFCLAWPLSTHRS